MILNKKSNFIFTLMLLITTFRGDSAKRSKNPADDNTVIERLEIDLSSLLLNKTLSPIYLYQIESSVLKKLSGFDIQMSRLHSNQLDEATLRSFFKVENRTSVLFWQEATSREKMCTHVKSCATGASSESKCALDINLILYLSPSLTYKHVNRHFNLVKLVKISLLVSNLSEDVLEFENKTYEYNVDSSSSHLSLGSVKAVSAKNADLNGLVKYYIVANTVSSRFRVDETTGAVSTMSGSGPLQPNVMYEFFVDAFLQCSFLKPLKNRTLVRVNLVSANYSRPKIVVTYLIETTQLLSNTSECIRLTRNDMVENVSIGLAQLQIETPGQDLSALNLKVESIKGLGKSSFSYLFK